MIEEIIDVLVTAGYARLSPTLQIGGATFSFGAILAAEEDDAALTIVADTDQQDLRSLRKDFRAISLSLGRVRSRRPITLVVISEDSGSDLMRDLGLICRLIVVRPGDEAHSALLPLLPLQLPEGAIGGRSAIAELRQELGELQNDPYVIDLMGACQRSSAVVEARSLEEVASATRDPERRR